MSGYFDSIMLKLPGWLRGGQENGRSVSRKPQLLVDVSVIYGSDAQTGIQRVVRAVWSELRALTPDSHDLLAVAATRKRSYRIVPSSFLELDDRPPLKILPRVGARVKGDAFLGLDLCSHIISVQSRQLRAWKRQQCRLWFMVYDLLPLHHPNWFTSSLARRFLQWLNFLGQHADGVVCISQTVADKFEGWLKEGAAGLPRPIEIGTTRLGADIEASVPSRGITEEEGLLLQKWSGRPILLCVGTVEPRKGHDCLLEAFSIAQEKSDLRLVVVGKPGWKTEQVQAHMRALQNQNDRFFWLSGASDEMLVELYRRANLVIVPSRDEGFGLPILEALAHGCPVLARDIPVFRELAGIGVHYFESDRADLLADDIARVIASAGRSSRCLGGHHNWRECTLQILHLLDLNAAR